MDKKKWLVTLKETTLQDVVVTAETEDEAKKIACKLPYKNFSWDGPCEIGIDGCEEITEEEAKELEDK